MDDGYGDPYRAGNPTVGDLRESFGADHFQHPLMGQVSTPARTDLMSQLKNFLGGGDIAKAGFITAGILLLLVAWQKGWFKNISKEWE